MVPVGVTEDLSGCEEESVTMRRVRRRCDDVLSTPISAVDPVSTVPALDLAKTNSPGGAAAVTCVPIHSQRAFSGPGALINVQGDMVAPLPTPCRRPHQLDPAVTGTVEMHHMPVCFQPPNAGTPSFRIVCYGDSLTAGYCSHGRVFEPYGRMLCNALQRVGIASNVNICGLVGKTADHLVEGLQLPVLRDQLEHEGLGLARMIYECRPDLVVLMAGTNDLSRGHSPERTFGSVQKLHAACNAHRIPTVALIPPVKMRGPTRIMQQRLAALLIEWANKSSSVVGIFDVEKMVPRRPPRHFWDADEIHMSLEGQRTLGERLGERLACLPLLAAARTNSSDLCHDAISGVDGQSAGDCARTLTGFFATKNVTAANRSAVPAQQHAATHLPVGGEVTRCGLQACLEAAPPAPTTMSAIGKQDCNAHISPSGHGVVPATGTPPSFSASSICLGIKGFSALSAVLQSLVHTLVKHEKAMSVQRGCRKITVGLNVWGENLGGWTGVGDLQADLQRLQGDAIFEKLQFLANRACAALSLSTAAGSAPAGAGDRWGDVNHVTARLQVQGASPGEDLHD